MSARRYGRRRTERPWKLVELRLWCSGRSPRSSPPQDWPARPPRPPEPTARDPGRRHRGGVARRRTERRAGTRGDRRRVHAAGHDRLRHPADDRSTPTRSARASTSTPRSSSALAATPHSRIALPVTYSRARAARIVDSLAERVDRQPVAAQVIGATAAGPVFTAAKAGVAVDVNDDASAPCHDC